jgi:hypothetical protein
MSRFDAPAWRIAGSFVSWAAYVFFFLGLFQAMGVVMGLGGYCASGGPYVIETECPDGVVLFAPGGVFGGLAAVAIGSFFSRGFGVSLLSWAWPILFVGLGIQFLVGASGGQGIIVNIVCGVLFVAMGVAPVYFLMSSKALTPTLLGSINAAGQHFAYEGQARRYFGITKGEEGQEVAATPGDWALSILLWVVAVVLGAFLSFAAFAAIAAG